MFQGGVTDITTAKVVAKRLYMQYCGSSQMERNSMERMLIDTYKIMVELIIYRIRIISQHLRMLIYIIKFLISMEMEELVWRTLNH